LGKLIGVVAKEIENEDTQILLAEAKEERKDISV